MNSEVRGFGESYLTPQNSFLINKTWIPVSISKFAISVKYVNIYQIVSIQ